MERGDPTQQIISSNSSSSLPSSYRSTNYQAAMHHDMAIDKGMSRCAECGTVVANIAGKLYCRGKICCSAIVFPMRRLAHSTSSLNWVLLLLWMRQCDGIRYKNEKVIFTKDDINTLYTGCIAFTAIASCINVLRIWNSNIPLPCEMKCARFVTRLLSTVSVNIILVVYVDCRVALWEFQHTETHRRVGLRLVCRAYAFFATQSVTAHIPPWYRMHVLVRWWNFIPSRDKISMTTCK